MTDTASDKLSSYAEIIEEALALYMPNCPFPESKVAEAMAYSLLGGGKRIRGTLVLAFYGLYHEDVKPALPFACALEMVHAYSLIHDDLPCMDDDELRRGKASCHVAFGEATALLAGDALLTLAFALVADNENRRYFDADVMLQAAKRLSDAAGILGMIGGQAIDMEQEGKPTPRELLDRMYAKKTGALLSAAAAIGCMLAGASEAETAAALGFAACMGLAFQIVDDILDITADEALLGKPVGSDDGNEKSTYVSLYGLEEAKREAKRLNGQAKKDLGGLPRDTSFLMWLADYIADRQK